eukprot:s130_g11.t1
MDLKDLSFCQKLREPVTKTGQTMRPDPVNVKKLGFFPKFTKDVCCPSVHMLRFGEKLQLEALQNYMVTGRDRHAYDLTGRCLGPASCEVNAEVQAQECELFLPTTLQRWDVNELGIIHSEGCPGLCLTPSGNTPVSWSDRTLVMGTLWPHRCFRVI